MKYYDIAARIGGEKWAKERLKKMKGTDECKKSRDLTDEDCIKAAEALRSEAEYSVQSLYSIGALVISCLSFLASIVTVIINTFDNGQMPIYAGITFVALLFIGTFFGLHVLCKAFKNHKEYEKARILEDSLKFMRNEQSEEKEVEK